MTIDISTAITIAIALLGLSGALTKIIWEILNARIEAVNTSAKEAHTSAVEAHKRVDKEVFDRAAADLANAAERRTEVATVRDTLHDLEVTVAGFGGTFATKADLSKAGNSEHGGK